ncbi:hypothetical protein IFM89_022096 [Coptis chinensis]|uniref:non-specific serine/threonine protein kinase n=1 Tax=Coptis chinensis TaxID=261450 RepID=A0A835HEJ2_9MAGN|nr:hypothetical protein IFM89_022096 [Coptis chinensis]
MSDNQFLYGKAAKISVVNESRTQYMTLRYFPADNRKYCYTLDVKTRTRYLVRASFLYGNFDNNNVYPKFDLSLGATHWSTIVISDATTIEMQELIFLATSPTVSVCLSNATTGQPFISALELRPFNGSIYYTNQETQFFLSVAARINFGAESDEPVRYPDDPFDRIWESDSLKKANYLVDVADGTEKVSTRVPITMGGNDSPPQKVMQTAVVGTKGTLTYRLNLYGFPGYGWAVSYFAEIEDLSPNDTRIFRLSLPGMPDVSSAAVNIQENAHGRYRVYEPGYPNISLPFVLNFRFVKATESTRGPLLNAMEINKYLEINDGSLDAIAVASLVSHYPLADWAGEGGDPCLPVPWSWLQCNSDPQPRIVSIILSGKNLTGNIPVDLTNLPGLIELWLDGNALTGPIPDFTKCTNLKIMYLQNNTLSGIVPSSLLNGNLVLKYSGNANLHEGKAKRNNMTIIIGSLVGAAVLLIVTIISCLFVNRGKKRYSEEDEITSVLPAKRPLSSFICDVTTETAHSFTISEIEYSTRKFEKKIGSGGFGVVYYGKLEDGKEIAVKVLTNNSYQGKREFSNEVALLSRIHHRNLVQFLGYCQLCQEEIKSIEAKSILVYEYMHNGTLKEHLYGPVTREASINWIKRLEIAEDAAKGIEYLHTGCVPTIIHRDLKSSNILLDKHMRAKVSDFGLSKLEVDGVNHVSSVVRGTVGYLDPDGSLACFVGHTEAKLHIQSGDIQGIIDPSLRNEFNIQSVWKIAEKAMMCVQPHGSMRPSISEVLKEIQDSILIERVAEASREGNSDDISRNSLRSSINTGMGTMDFGANESHVLFDESIVQPSVR